MRALRQIRLETIFDVPALVNRVVNAGSKQVAPQSECFQPSPGSLRQRSATPLAWKCKLRCALRVGRPAAQREARGRRRHKAAEACAGAATCRHALRCAPGQDHRLLGEPAQPPLKRQSVCAWCGSQSCSDCHSGSCLSSTLALSSFVPIADGHAGQSDIWRSESSALRLGLMVPDAHCTLRKQTSVAN